MSLDFAPDRWYSLYGVNRLTTVTGSTDEKEALKELRGQG